MSQTFEGKRGKEGGRNPYARHFGCLRKSCPFLLYLRAGETEWEWPCFAVRNQFRNQFGGKIKKGNSRKYFKGRWGELLSFLFMCVWSFSSHFSQMKQKKKWSYCNKRFLMINSRRCASATHHFVSFFYITVLSLAIYD